MAEQEGNHSVKHWFLKIGTTDGGNVYIIVVSSLCVVGDGVEKNCPDSLGH